MSDGGSELDEVSSVQTERPRHREKAYKDVGLCEVHARTQEPTGEQKAKQET